MSHMLFIEKPGPK